MYNTSESVPVTEVCSWPKTIHVARGGKSVKIRQIYDTVDSK